MSQFETKAFKSLFKEWNQKLKDSGHEEIEDFSFKEPKLKEYDSLWFQIRHRQSDIKFEAKRRYYLLAHDLLNSYKFKSEVHRQIWEMHADGLSERKIAAKMSPKPKKSQVHKIISFIAKEIK